MRLFLNEIEKIICAVIFLAMTILGFANVVVRYLSDSSFAATQEILLNGFLIITVFGAAIAARRGEHLAVTLFTDILPAQVRRLAIMLATLLSVILLILSAWFCLGLVQHQYASGVVSPGLQIPVWYYSLGLPAGFLLVAVRLLQSLHENLNTTTSGSAQDV
jgi:TRAP-type C4-dicarboxylate transport system permease small subunit